MRKRICRAAGVLTLLSVLFFSACTSSKTPGESVSEVEQLESQLFSELKEPNEEVAKQLMDSYEQFAKDHPEHEQAPVYLDQSANIARSIFKDYQRGLDCYSRIVEKYPNYERIIDIKFFIAFMYDNELKDKAKAEEHYRAIANEYPNHIFGKNAKDRLETLHLSDKELIEKWEKKNSESKEN